MCCRALPATGCCSIAVFGVDGASGALQLSEICIVEDVPESFSPQHISLDTGGRIVCAQPRERPLQLQRCFSFILAVDSPDMSMCVWVADCGDGGTLCQFFLDTNHGKLLRMGEYACGGEDGLVYTQWETSLPRNHAMGTPIAWFVPRQGCF